MKPAMRWKHLSRAPRIALGLLARGRYDYSFDLVPMSVTDMTWARRTNLLRSGLNLLHRRPKPWSWPIHLQVELSNVCDLQCPVCPTGRGLLRRKGQFMDMGLYERLMREAGKRLLSVFLWAWGEPLLHPQLEQALAIARGHGVLPLLSTNGQSLARPGVVDALVKQPPEYLIVAIDGLTQATQEVFRVGSRLDVILEGVRALREARDRAGQSRPLLHMRMIAMKHNLHEVSRARNFALEHGFDMLSIRGLSIIDDKDETFRKLAPDDEHMGAYRFKGGRRQSRTDFLCQHAFALPAVLSDGTVVACDQDFNAQHAYGRIGQDGSFEDIWFGPRARQIRRAIRDRRDAYSFCRNCPYADREINTCSIESFVFNRHTRDCHE